MIIFYYTFFIQTMNRFMIESKMFIKYVGKRKLIRQIEKTDVAESCTSEEVHDCTCFYSVFSYVA